MTAAEFERRYRAMPDVKKAELVEGVVYVASPVSDDHASSHSNFNLWLGYYRVSTPGLVVASDGTVRLDIDNRPQPDLHLRITTGAGGRARVDDDGYVSGPPELIAEVAISSASYDLHDKFDAYRRNVVLEYLVWRVRDRAIDWFVLRDGRYERLALTPEGQLRSTIFPGLWLDPDALIRDDMPTVLLVLQQGLASPEHAAFVAELRARAAGRPAE